MKASEHPSYNPTLTVQGVTAAKIAALAASLNRKAGR